MDQQERVVFSIVPILLLILLLRRACRIRFLLTYNYLDLGTKESAAVCRRQRHRQRRARRQAWVYPRQQGWLEEMYDNRLLRALWKDHFRVTRETFDFILKVVKDEELALLKSMFAQTHAPMSGKINFMFIKYESTNVL